MNAMLEERWYPGEEHFVDGYVPQSLNAEYSSLNRSLTWIGMGLFLATLAGLGTFIFGLAVRFSEDESRAALGSTMNPDAFIVAGLVMTLVFVTAGYTCIRLGRSNYRKYKREYGMRH